MEGYLALEHMLLKALRLITNQISEKTKDTFSMTKNNETANRQNTYMAVTRAAYWCLESKMALQRAPSSAEMMAMMKEG